MSQTKQSEESTDYSDVQAVDKRIEDLEAQKRLRLYQLEAAEIRRKQQTVTLTNKEIPSITNWLNHPGTVKNDPEPALLTTSATPKITPKESYAYFLSQHHVLTATELKTSDEQPHTDRSNRDLDVRELELSTEKHHDHTYRMSSVLSLASPPCL